MQYLMGDSVIVGQGRECCWGCTDETAALQCRVHVPDLTVIDLTTAPIATP